MKSFGIVASGESIRYLPEVGSNFDNCVVFNNCSKELNHFADIFRKKKIGQVINKIPEETLPPDIYKKFNINSVYFVVREKDKYLYRDTIAKLTSYGVNYYVAPEEMADFFGRYKYINLSHYALENACRYVAPAKMYIVGLDFYEGDYLFQKTSAYLKEKAKRIRMVDTFHDIVSRYPDIKFYIWTKSPNVKATENLEVTYV